MTALAEVAAQSFNAAVTIASKTGCTSAGELAMTFRISAVAVCRSSASRVSLNRRTFSMAMTACAAKVSISAISSALNGRTSRRQMEIVPIACPARSIGTPRMVRKPKWRWNSERVGVLGRGHGHEIRHVNRPALDEGAAVHRRGQRAHGERGVGRRPAGRGVHRHGSQHAFFFQEDVHVRGAAQLTRVARQRLEDRPYVGR